MTVFSVWRFFLFFYRVKTIVCVGLFFSQIVLLPLQSPHNLLLQLGAILGIPPVGFYGTIRHGNGVIRGLGIMLCLWFCGFHSVSFCVKIILARWLFRGYTDLSVISWHLYTGIAATVEQL